MIAARAVVTERGGSTSHAAVVTRALGRPSVVGVGEGVSAELAGRELTVDGIRRASSTPASCRPSEVDPADVPGPGRADRLGARAEPGRGGRRGARRGRPRRGRDRRSTGGRARRRRSSPRALRGAAAARARCWPAPRAPGPCCRAGVAQGGAAARTARGGAAAAARAGANVQATTRRRERDVSDSDAAARPYPDKWARESATPMVERYHSAVRALVAERFAASGKSWEEAVERPARSSSPARTSRRSRPTCSPTGYLFDVSATISLKEEPDKYKPLAGIAEHRRARHRRGGTPDRRHRRQRLQSARPT